jgi:hypothetical protein
MKHITFASKRSITRITTGYIWWQNSAKRLGWRGFGLCPLHLIAEGLLNGWKQNGITPVKAKIPARLLAKFRRLV